jgi:hypothetical protein
MQAAMNANTSRLLAIFLAILGASALRLVPHPPNFTPIGAMALFSGAYLGRRGLMAFAAPLGAMLLSDAVIGFHSGMPFVYASIGAIVVIGWLTLQMKSPLRIGVAAIASSMLFFIVTNFGTWAVSGMYPLTVSGLAACYVAAVPFFQNTIAGDLFYSGLLFGGFALLERAVPALRPRGTAQPA